MRKERQAGLGLKGNPAFVERNSAIFYPLGDRDKDGPKGTY